MHFQVNHCNCSQDMCEKVILLSCKVLLLLDLSDVCFGWHMSFKGHRHVGSRNTGERALWSSCKVMSFVGQT